MLWLLTRVWVRQTANPSCYLLLYQVWDQDGVVTDRNSNRLRDNHTRYSTSSSWNECSKSCSSNIGHSTTTISKGSTDMVAISSSTRGLIKAAFSKHFRKCCTEHKCMSFVIMLLYWPCTGLNRSLMFNPAFALMHLITSAIHSLYFINSSI